MSSFVRQSRIPLRKRANLKRTAKKPSPKPRNRKPLPRSQKTQLQNRRRGLRNEREGSNKGSSQGSQDRHDRRGTRRASRSRRCRGDARGASFRDCEHKNEGGSRFVGCETVAAKGDRTRSRRLRILANLARWWCRLRTEAAGLLQESFQDTSPSRVSQSIE